jgi:hypothetical protein
VNKKYSDRIFVLGIPRSGTTLAINMLKKGQPNIGGSTRESHFYNKYFNRKFTKDILEDAYFKGLLPSENLLHVFSKSKSYVDFFEKTTDEFLHLNKKVIFIEKTPQHVFFCKEITHDFPDAKFIIVRRNIYANIQSLAFSKRRGSMLLVDRFEVFSNWKFLRYLLGIGKYYMYNHYLIKAEKFPQVIHNLKFDELVTNPNKVKNDLESVLGVKLDDLKPTKKPATKNLSLNTKESVFHKQTIDAYKELMPRYIQYLIKQTFVSSRINLIRIGMYTFYLFPFHLMKLILFRIRGQRS